MAREKSKNETTKVQATISQQMATYLDQLVDAGTYGNSPSEVARYLIQRGLDDLLRNGVIEKPRGKSV